MLPDFDALGAIPEAGQVVWPSLAWERDLLENINHPAFPKIVETFTEDGFEYLVEESPTGPSLWDAWDDPEASTEAKYGYLTSIAEGLKRCTRPALSSSRCGRRSSPSRQAARRSSTTCPSCCRCRCRRTRPSGGTLYTAPEIVAGSAEKTDARADLYSFGAMLYRSVVGRELVEKDFEKQQGVPKEFIPAVSGRCTRCSAA